MKRLWASIFITLLVLLAIPQFGNLSYFKANAVRENGGGGGENLGPSRHCFVTASPSTNYYSGGGVCVDHNNPSEFFKILQYYTLTAEPPIQTSSGEIQRRFFVKYNGCKSFKEYLRIEFRKKHKRYRKDPSDIRCFVSNPILKKPSSSYGKQQ